MRPGKREWSFLTALWVHWPPDGMMHMRLETSDSVESWHNTTMETGPGCTYQGGERLDVVRVCHVEQRFILGYNLDHPLR